MILSINQTRSKVDVYTHKGKSFVWLVLPLGDYEYCTPAYVDRCGGIRLDKATLKKYLRKKWHYDKEH